MGVSQYVEIFLDEANGHIQNLKECVLALEADPDNLRLVNEAARAAHSLTGMAATMGFIRMEHLACQVEQVFLRLISEKTAVSGRALDLLSECFLALERYLKTIRQTSFEGADDNEALLRELYETVRKPIEAQQQGIVLYHKIRKKKPDFSRITFTKAEKKAMVSAIRTGSRIYGFEVAIHPNCLFKVARALLVWKAAETFGWMILSRPDIAELAEKQFGFRFSFLMASGEDLEQIAFSIEKVSEIRLEAAGEVKPETLFQKKASQEKPIGDSMEDSRKETSRTASIDAEKLHDLTEKLLELVLVKNRLIAAYASQKEEDGAMLLDEQMEAFSYAMEGMKESVLEMRMVPMERVVNKFPRMLRDFARKQEREIELYISGADTQVDRAAAEQIAEPLWQLIQNIAVYGVVPPDLPRQRIYLTIFREETQAVICVNSDGVVDMTSAQKIIGMLRRTVDELGGDIEVRGGREESVSYSVRLPVTQTVIQALAMQVGEEYYAVALPFIFNIEEILEKDIDRSNGEETVLFGDEIIPLVRLAERLGIESPEEEKKTHTAVLVKQGGKRAGILVDRLLGQQEIVIRPIGKWMQSSKTVRGAAILNDGEIALVLDVGALI